jgi:hypothetical protein
MAGRRPIYPRIPCLPKGSEGGQERCQPWRWSTDDQARRHAEDDTDRYLPLSAPARAQLRNQVTFDAPLSVLRAAGPGLSHRPRPGQHRRDPGAIIGMHRVRSDHRGTGSRWLWPFLMNTPPSRTAGILASVCAGSLVAEEQRV